MNAAAIIQQGIEAIEYSRDLVARMQARQPAVQWVLDGYHAKTHAAILALRELAATTAQADDLPDAVNDAVAAALGDAYDCTRTWSAWGVGTMGPEDFHLVAEDGDRVAEIARAAVDALRAARPLNYDPADPDKMVLPKGATCGDCVHIKRCKGMFGHTETDTYCDWSPSRFHAAEKGGA